MKLDKIPPPQKKGVLVAQRLLEEFRTAQLRPGQRLPSERGLAESLGVSRTVVREALSALQMVGIVESRVGDGTYISATFNAEKLSLPPILRNLDASVSVLEALEAREALDISAAHLAIENAKDEELHALDTIVQALGKAVEREDILSYLKLTLDLHIEIAHAGGNSMLEQAVTYLIELIRPHLWVIAENYTKHVMEESYAIHAAIVGGVRKRDLQAVIAAVRQHYHSYPSLQRESATP
ncbi:MAG: FadR/GntR family transcriptional regulator [Acidiferrobacterales bacterium]